MHYDGMPLQKQIALTLRVIIVCCSIYYVHHIFVLFRDGNASNNASKISGKGLIDVERYYLSTSSECQHIVNSRAFHIDCMPVPASLYPVLITGLGGCGSHNIANLFDRMGVELPHEGLGRDGSVVRVYNWMY